MVVWPEDKSKPRVDLSAEDISMIKSRVDLSDECIWELIDKDNKKYNRRRGLNNKDTYLQKVRRYLHSISKSEGFECTDFPGCIGGLTVVQAILDSKPIPAYYITECLGYFDCLANEAFKVYKEQTGTSFVCMCVLSVNSLSINQSCTYYYITFTAEDPEQDFVRTAFQAKVRDEDFNWDVLFCRPNTDFVMPIKFFLEN